MINLIDLGLSWQRNILDQKLYGTDNQMPEELLKAEDG